MKKSYFIVPVCGVLILLPTLLFGNENSSGLKDRVDLFSQNTTQQQRKSEVTQSLVNSMPAPGTYALQRIFKTPNLYVLDSKRKKISLRQYTTGKLTLLTFFYSRCSDAKGCPLAMATFHKVKTRLESQPGMANEFRLVSISFDPERDMPEMMGGLEHQMHQHGDHVHESDNVPWNFLTTSSVAELLPMLREFGQDVDIQLDPTTGEKTLTYRHLVKVFLIDKEGYVREIYTSMSLDPQILFNDIKTLQLENTRHQ